MGEHVPAWPVKGFCGLFCGLVAGGHFWVGPGVFSVIQATTICYCPVGHQGFHSGLTQSMVNTILYNTGWTK